MREAIQKRALMITKRPKRSWMRSCLFMLGVLFLLAACSGPNNRLPAYATTDELLEKELGDAKVLDSKMWNGNTLLLFLRNQGTTREEVAVGAIRQVDRGYAWIPSSSVRIDIAARFDFDLRDGNEAVNIYIGRAARENVSQVYIRGIPEPFGVYDGYFWGFQLPEYVKVEKEIPA